MTIDPIVERAQHLEEPVESELHRDAVNESILGLEPADGDLSPEAELEQTRAVAGPDAEVLTDGGESEDEDAHAELRDDEPTDERTHAARNAENLTMADYDTNPEETESSTDYDGDIKPGDVVLDLAQGRAMHVLERYDGDAGEWSEENGYDLCGNYANSRFDADPDDRVFECVYCSNVKSEPSKTYAFPESRLVRVETEAADGGRQVYDRVVVELLEQLFDAAYRSGSDRTLSILEGLAQDATGKDVVNEARELAEVERTIGGEA